MLSRLRIAAPLPSATAIFAAALLSMSLSSCGSSGAGDSTQQSRFKGAALPGDLAAPPFTLTDQNGRRVSLASLRGEVVVIAFLYSRCGASCVLLAEQIRGALDELSRPVSVLLVSADPAADSSASVRRFLSETSLAGRVHYLAAPEQAVHSVLRAYAVKSETAHDRALGTFQSVLLVDRHGIKRVLYGLADLTPESLSEDIRTLQGG
jgi:protein SCO1/2